MGSLRESGVSVHVIARRSVIDARWCTKSLSLHPLLYCWLFYRRNVVASYSYNKAEGKKTEKRHMHVCCFANKIGGAELRCRNRRR